ncbi:MAG: hypothetical protein CL946_12490 [Ectothiorhodospiraceae bacterium]|nr:hypothetical protein [Ectothiorhodospiraceae bacterium]
MGAYQYLLDWHLKWYIDNHPDASEPSAGAEPTSPLVKGGLKGGLGSPDNIVGDTDASSTPSPDTENEPSAGATPTSPLESREAGRARGEHKGGSNSPNNTGVEPPDGEPQESPRLDAKNLERRADPAPRRTSSLARSSGPQGGKRKTTPDPFLKARGGVPAIFQSPAGGWRLTTAERKRILLANIYGVDIDAQAVEVTKLSLLLKVLEGESDESLQQQTRLKMERALPDLAGNIKCGNSLIGSDFYEGQMELLDDETMYRVNAFDWDEAFPQVFPPLSRVKRDGQGGTKGGISSGFDAVIGNPPYVRQEMLGEYKDYFKTHYQTYAGTADLYTYFIERGVALLKQGGRFGYIVANKWMRANYGKALRAWMKTQAIEEITDFGDLPVFIGATTYPCILVISKDEPQETFTATTVDTLDFTDLCEHVSGISFTMKREGLDDGGWALVDSKQQDLLLKLRAKGIPLGDYVEGKIYRGVLTGLNKAFVIDNATKDKLVDIDPKSADILKPFLAGRDIKRYEPLVTDKWLIFTRRGIDINAYPAIKEYLEQFKTKLTPKPKGWKGEKWPGRKPGSYKWYEIQDSIDYWREFEKPKIMLPDITLRGNFTYDPGNHFYSVNTTYIISTSDLDLLGLLNSNLIDFFYRNITSSYRGGYLRYIFQYMVTIPIVDTANALTTLVERMLDLHKRLAEAHTSHDKKLLQQQIALTDREIDRLVYDLYELTDEEIRIVEKG